jgi:ubiquinone/menaquinone biosynthesis C-methylase UbiE
MTLRRPLRKDDSYNEYVKDFYRTIEDYDWNDVTDKGRGLESILHRRREKRMKSLIKEYGHGEKYLDIGCGTGLILRHLPAGAVGIDLNPRHLERARRYAPKAKVMIGDAEKLEFPDQAFSTIVCTEVLEHLVHPEQALAHMARVLQPGGRVIGSTPRHALLWRLRFLSSTHYHNEPFHNEFVSSELRTLFKDWNIKLLQRGVFGAIFFFVLEKK